MSREQVKNEKGTKRLVVSASAYVFDEVLSLRTQGSVWGRRRSLEAARRKCPGTRRTAPR